MLKDTFIKIIEDQIALGATMTQKRKLVYLAILIPTISLLLAIIGIELNKIVSATYSVIALILFWSSVWILMITTIGIFFLILIRKNEELSKLTRELKNASITDELTGLHNSRFLKESLGTIISKAARHNEFAYLCFIDLDNFKSINDTYGHRAGDHALQAVAKTLHRIVRSADIVARYGGDEFVIFWTSNNLSKSEDFLKRIEGALANITFFNDDREISISGTIGFTCEDASGENVLEKLLSKADAAMLENKKSR